MAGIGVHDPGGEANGVDWPDVTARRAIRRRVLGWYDRFGRDLPWRRRQSDAYAQWVAEIMLQQTQVTTVKGYYDRFLARFPTVAALAEADREELMRLWQGLGYYRRAEHLHRAARLVCRERGGRLPDTAAEWMTLPGVGRYTAGAIASVAFGRRAPVVDGNVVRVFSRLFRIETDGATAAAKRRYWLLAESLLPRKRCGDFNQALMDLGATVCVPGEPDCGRCPLSSLCAARSAGTASSLPGKTRRAAVTQRRMVAAIVVRRGRFLMRRRPAGGLWSGLWEFLCEVVSGRSTARSLRTLLGPYDIDATTARSLGPFVHRLTHVLIRFDVFALRVDGARPATAGNDMRWVGPADLNDTPMSTAGRRMLAMWRADAAATDVAGAEPKRNRRRQQPA